MAKTIPLNSGETVWVTTYFGGVDRGTCFDISMLLDNERQVTSTYSIEDLRALLLDRGTIQGLAKPAFDQPAIPRTPEEYFENLDKSQFGRLG